MLRLEAFVDATDTYYGSLERVDEDRERESESVGSRCKDKGTKRIDVFVRLCCSSNIRYQIE